MDSGKPQSLSRMNRRLILNLLSSATELSVAELSERAHLSKPTIAKILNQYLARGLVVNVGKGSSTDEGGKRPTLYRFNEKAGRCPAFFVHSRIGLQKSVEDLPAVSVQRADIPNKELNSVAVGNQQPSTGQPADTFLSHQDEGCLAPVGFDLPDTGRCKRGYAPDPLYHRHEIA